MVCPAYSFKMVKEKSAKFVMERAFIAVLLTNVQKEAIS